MKVERVSYDVMTPSAARGILEAIYWKPAIRWVIDKIRVCNPIQFTNIRRNEVSEKAPGAKMRTTMNKGGVLPALYTSEAIQQRASLLLKDVCYVIEAHFFLTEKAGEADTKEKHYAIASRRIREGRCYHQPCFGCREFPAYFESAEDNMPAAIDESRDLGYMLYDMDFSDTQNIQPMFFRAYMQDGVISPGDCGVVR